MITMTIEVSPEQAVEIAKILSNPAPTPAAPVQNAPVTTVPYIQQQIPVAAPAAAPAPVPPTVPTAVKKYTMDELSLGSRPIVEAGRQQELLDFLHSFTYFDANGVQKNVQSIRDLPEEMYPAFANGIRQMGGRI